MNDLDVDLEALESRVLDPVDRISEVLFGLFMALTFTGTLSVASAGRDEVLSMMVAAIGCNIAWGFVDAVMYVLRNLVARGRRLRLVNAVRDAAQPEYAHRLIGHEIGGLAGAFGPADLERVRQWLAVQPGHALPATHPTKQDLRGAVGIFLLVFLSTFPVVLPFVFIADPATAKRVSAVVAIGMLFVCGYARGPLRRPQARPHRHGHGASRPGHRSGGHRPRRLTGPHAPARPPGPTVGSGDVLLSSSKPASFRPARRARRRCPGRP